MKRMMIIIIFFLGKISIKHDVGLEHGGHAVSAACVVVLANVVVSLKKDSTIAGEVDHIAILLKRDFTRLGISSLVTPSKIHPASGGQVFEKI